MSEIDFNDGCSEKVTSVRMDRTSGLYSPDSGSTRSCCTTPRALETPVGKSRSPCSTPRSSVCDFDLKIGSEFTPIRQSQSPVHSDKGETEEVSRKSDEDCDAREDMYS